MNNVVILLCAFMAIIVVHAADKIADYVKVSRAQYRRVLDDYGVKLSTFSECNEGRIEAIAFQNELFAASILLSSEHLVSLSVLNNVTNECVRKYNDRVLTLERAKQAINDCKSKATVELITLFNTIADVIDALATYIQRDFDPEIINCGTGPTANYECVSTVISKANNFSDQHQKSFKYELKAAENSAKANAEKFAKCSYSVQSAVLTELGQLKVLIDNCITASNECPVCLTQSCIEVISVSLSPEDEIIANPLYGRTDKPKSVSLDLRWGDYLPVLDIDLENELNT